MLPGQQWYREMGLSSPTNPHQRRGSGPSRIGLGPLEPIVSRRPRRALGWLEMSVVSTPERVRSTVAVPDLRKQLWSGPTSTASL